MEGTKEKDNNKINKRSNGNQIKTLKMNQTFQASEPEH